MAAKQTLQARLVMESRGLAPSVRSVGFKNDWSRLYQAETFYLDLMLKPKDKHSTLIGQLLSEEGSALHGQVTLSHPDVGTSTIPLGREADFIIDIQQPDTYQLSISLANDTITISDLALN